MIEIFGTEDVITDNPGPCMLCYNKGVKHDIEVVVVVKILWDDTIVRLAVCYNCFDNKQGYEMIDELLGERGYGNV